MRLRDNITLAYVISYLYASWFWLGIWVYFYLHITDYAGIGLIESVMITSAIVFEIPTGAITDLVGRRKALILSGLLIASGNIGQAFSPNLLYMIISVLLITLGYAFYSGSLEALVYDTLLDKKKEAQFDQVIARINMIKLIAMAIASIIGGYVFTIDRIYPNILVGMGGLAMIPVSYLLTELRPKQQTGSRDFIAQFFKGYKELFSSKKMPYLSGMLILIAMMLVPFYEMLDDILAIEFGYTPQVLSILVATTFIAGAIGSQFTTTLIRKTSRTKAYWIAVVLVAGTAMVSPWIGLVLGGISIILRHTCIPIIDNISAIELNKIASSSNRATTLSTYTMIKNIPYVLLAFFIGRQIDSYSASYIALLLGALLLTISLGIRVKNWHRLV